MTGQEALSAFREQLENIIDLYNVGLFVDMNFDIILTVEDENKNLISETL